MSTRDTTIRSMHDIGAAIWLGGSLMGAVGLNGASSDIENKAERAKIAADGWARWAPVNAAAIGAHLIGGLGLVLANRDRVRLQSGVTANTVVKTTLTAAALVTTAYSGILGAKIGKAGDAYTEGVTEPSAMTPDDVAAAQKQLRLLQWATPVLTAAIVALGAQQGEQQRPASILSGIGKKISNRT